MKHSPISPDDPKLTAYALDELPLEERAAFETVLRDDAEAAATVEEIRAFAAQLEFALANEPESAADGPPVGGPVERWNGGADRPIHGSTGQLEPPAAARPPSRREKMLRFPEIASIGGTLAAACIALLVALHPRQGRIVRGDLSAAGSAKAERRLDGDASPYPKQAQPVRGGGTPPTASGVTGESAPSPVAGVADPGSPGSTSRATAEPSQPRDFRFVTNWAPSAAGGGVSLLEQVKRPSRLVVASAQARPLEFSGYAVVPPRQSPGGAGLRYLGRPAIAREDSAVLFEQPLAVMAAVVRTGPGTDGARGAAYLGGQRSQERPTFYYPPDEKFVIPVQRRRLERFVIPVPHSPLTGDAWETVPTPQGPWGTMRVPRIAGADSLPALPFRFHMPDATGKFEPKPFRFRLPGDWDNSIAKHPYLGNEHADTLTR